ncbi:cid13-like poly(A) RNA polymerase [Grosmannia clavigera kw1407]|uniref:polynucleotide adenylyltransferase n=1 Tax=Grosmannia clavigera (strain kw1407 / UAMH 11150) TaxID=655863 RepID=F0XFL7_GROCL|nr:cid13-like poly(A) RNA polymerase [Grosmannia clavigera kw1407]EFX03720.1 cid13-like poly(A) RNA polymerase [Grosmannia clavigera kw1407]
MFHQQQNGGGGGNGVPNAQLEDRLRNLILANNEATQVPSAASSTGASLAPPLEHGEPASTDTAKPGQPSVSPRFARKRPNQAQRRQMSAQLSVPVAWQSTSSHPVGGYANTPPYGQHQSHPRHQHNNLNSQSGYQHTYQRPQSATIRPSQYGNGHMTSTGFPAGENAYPSQPRHQQSQSYQGPVTYEDPYNWRSHQPVASSFNNPSSRNSRPPHNPNGRLYHAKPEDVEAQSTLLESLCEQILASAEIEPAEIQEKENFRAHIELLCQDALAKYEHEVNCRADFAPLSVRLKCFGSLASGFATKASDMDLAIISPLSVPQPDSSESPIPRLIEKAFLEAGLGARLLSRTRVPIIKLCESPPEQLRIDLLDERAKWEKGVLPEHDDLDADDDAVEDSEPSTARAGDHSAGDGKPKHAHKESDLDDEHHGEGRYGQSLGGLKQPASQSLGNYYATAKRLLRKIGGRDITHSTAREFAEKDLKILTDVCHAFVSGLADENLKGRLWETRSLATSDTPSQLNYRSLYGVYMQVEGERLAMLWDSREIHEKDAHQEDDACNRIRAWKELQNKPGFGVDLLTYNKELQVAVESLKRIASLQIITLEQGQFEPAAQYYDRTNKLLLHIGGRDTSAPSNAVLPLIIRHYVSGISNADIREQVQEFSQSMDKPSLRVVARRHKSLQLAVEFERAIGKGYYDASSTEDIEAYISVLRMPLQKCDLPGRRFDYLIPRNSDTAAIISRAGLLADPSKLAPNQPRDPYRDRLEFPKTGTGVQCDINFSAHLALQNTLLLRCYSHTDTRVRPMILFVKHWAKIRGINTPYRGTLSSYGYVLMVLHYLVNIAQPFVCPNLQQLAKPVPEGLSADEIEDTVTCRGHDVRFWRDEEEIKGLAMSNMLNQNKDSVGHLLRGFFEYYAQNNFMSTVPCRGFDWGRDVLSLRTPSGLRSKQDKGWTGARTVLEVRDQAAMPPSAADQPPTISSQVDSMASVAGSGGDQQPLQSSSEAKAGQTASTRSPKMAKAVEMKEVKHRYLFAIEDPFEHDHNVARTVTHSGIVAIRDEFRRAWRIIKNLGKMADENLLEDVTDNKAKERDHFAELLNDIHGPELSLH